MLTLLYVFLGIVALKIIINGSRYIETRHYLLAYSHYIKTKDGRKKGGEIAKSKARIKRLFKEAGVEDSILPLVENVGFGKLFTTTASAFDNIYVPREDVVSKLTISFYEALGVYRHRTLEAINPLFWLEEIINLPRVVLSYLGVSAESVVTRVFQILWWGVGVVVGLLYAIYQPDLEAVVRGYINNLLK